MTTGPIQPFDGIPIRLLLVDDSEEDYRRTCALLAAARHVTFAIEWAQSARHAMMQLAAGAYDVCVIDQCLTDGEGLDLVRAARDRGLQTPIIMLSGCSTLELDFAAMALGVSDFLARAGSMPRCSRAPSAMPSPGIARPSGSTGWRSMTS